MRKTSLLAITALLLISVLTSGCIFNFGAEKKINKVLDQYEKAMLEQDAKALVNLLIVKDVVEAMPEEIQPPSEEDDWNEFLESLLEQSMEKHEKYKLEKRNIKVNKDSAVVNAVEVSASLIDDDLVDDEVSMVFELRKISSSWKISMFDYVD